MIRRIEQCSRKFYRSSWSFRNIVRNPIRGYTASSSLFDPACGIPVGEGYERTYRKPDWNQYTLGVSKNLTACSLAVVFIIMTNLVIVVSASAQLIKGDAPELQHIDIKEKLGEKIPLDLDFVNENGKPVSLEEYLQDGKPLVLTLAYYECPMLCTFVLNGLSNAVKELGWSPGDKYNMLTVSIDPEETPALAKAKQSVYLDSLGKTGAGANWSFWTGREKQVKKLAETVGFQYFYDSKKDEYAHPAVVFVLTGEGVVSRYLYGIEYPSKNLRLALLEASEGKIGTIVDRVLLYCYHYDPVGRKYTLMAMNIMRIGAGFAAFSLALFLGFMWRNEKRADR